LLNVKVTTTGTVIENGSDIPAHIVLFDNVLEIKGGARVSSDNI